MMKASLIFLVVMVGMAFAYPYRSSYRSYQPYGYASGYGGYGGYPYGGGMHGGMGGYGGMPGFGGFRGGFGYRDMDFGYGDSFYGTYFLT